MSSSSIRSVATFCLLVLVAAGALWREFFWHGASSEKDIDPVSVGRQLGPETLTEAKEIDEHRQHQASPEPKEPQRPATPLPAADLGFSDQWQDLLNLAERGDPDAICRVTLGASYCLNIASKQVLDAAYQRMLEARSSRDDERAIELIARSKELDGGFCDGIDPEAIKARIRVDSFPLDRLRPRQKAVLALTRGDGTLRRLVKDAVMYSQPADVLLPDSIARSVPAFLNEGFQAGDALALEGLVMMHSPGMLGAPPGVTVALPDSQLFARFAMLMSELFGRESLGQHAPLILDAVLARMTPQQRLDLDIWVDRERSRWGELPQDIEQRRSLRRFNDGEGLSELCH